MLERGYFQVSPRNNPFGEFFVRIFRKEWKGYSSIFEHPELFKRIVTENPLLVVHPGYLGYLPRRDKSEIDFKRYDQYLGRLRAKIADALEKKRAVMVFTPTAYLRETLSALSYPQGVILLPTVDSSVTEDDFLMQGPGYEFLEALAETVESVEICGEVREECVMEVERRMALHGAQVNYDELCTFSPRQLSV